MSDHYDTLETRDPAAREREQLARLPEALTQAMTAPGWARQLTGVDPKSITSRQALAKLPLLHKPVQVQALRERVAGLLQATPVHPLTGDAE